MGWKSLAAAALLAQYASAQGGNMFRFACSQLVIERLDPIVTPGSTPSPHVHQIVGGNSFNATMDPTLMDPAKTSTCTTCTFAEDMSNYWTASLYFKSPENGSYRRVPQMANFGLTQDGGITVYYMQPFGGSAKITSFKPGFRMVSGDAALRGKAGTIPGICHRCNGNGEGFAPCDNKDTSEFPAKTCPGGIRATVIFPSCWDGKNLDSADHKSHMSYPPGSKGGLANSACPATHPIRVPQVMYEIMWDTRGFNDKKYFQNGKQPFVYSFSDTTGHGQHGDYLFGWKDDSLQKAMDGLAAGKCANNICPLLTVQPNAKAMACKKEAAVKEDVGVSNGWITDIPGARMA